MMNFDEFVLLRIDLEKKETVGQDREWDVGIERTIRWIVQIQESRVRAKKGPRVLLALSSSFSSSHSSSFYVSFMLYAAGTLVQQSAG